MSDFEHHTNFNVGRFRPRLFSSEYTCQDDVGRFRPMHFKRDSGDYSCLYDVGLSGPIPSVKNKVWVLNDPHTRKKNNHQNPSLKSMGPKRPTSAFVCSQKSSLVKVKFNKNMQRYKVFQISLVNVKLLLLHTTSA